ncbi:hypothetical protein ThrDRAFT_04223 [Frankia casuarinae]|uniref:Phosphatidylglycerol lysyltransferase C-terminal domain-containing protein n=2 Tax=Frankia casuarinae (strain DSM 45818 / CECT 9043 / HFP020203 / CcI3) TaxID=106370 RepID=Q2J805_FRACC|nr:MULTISPECIES: DUF2156 domain-containing protein [Frankia]KEZ35342.1 hypothetical protein CEDDRAFT_03273 [Frankia sp. CeD]KFB02906.1 hypothetical protein ALLO2DRAFT_04347 [Frankia sp. Allo2]ABD12587.1 protein of unknown function DUF470 [Frankia casuarinae]ETA00235.1 hypothetical protein CcI6DRAFT_04346 [Frankia sp. CcI6]EYT90156.1 hypothetical protein ThrDRAFT_04223 [Frankia casuarinae]
MTRSSSTGVAQTRSVAEPTLDVLTRHAHNPSAYLALNEGNLTFEVDGIDGVVIYRPSGRFLIQFGGVFAPPDQQAELLTEFVRWARQNRRRVISVQLMPEDTDIYLRAGFGVNQLGASYARSLDGFSMSGKHFVKIRNKISRANRDGVRVREVAAVRERTPQLMEALNEVDWVWLKAKGFGVAEIDFMIGQRGGWAERRRRLFVAEHAGRLVGYQVFSPVFGRHSGWLHDLSRRIPDAPTGVSELILSTAVRQFVGEKTPYLHFGLTPFTSLDPKHRLPGHSPFVDRFVRWLGTRAEWIYPAQSQVAYKLKWQPDLIQPEYVAFQDGVSLSAVWRLMRVTKAVSLRRGRKSVTRRPASPHE